LTKTYYKISRIINSNKYSGSIKKILNIIGIIPLAKKILILNVRKDNLKPLEKQVISPAIKKGLLLFYKDDILKLEKKIKTNLNSWLH
jgi:hypothetical protein